MTPGATRRLDERSERAVGARPEVDDVEVGAPSSAAADHARTLEHERILVGRARRESRSSVRSRRTS